MSGESGRKKRRYTGRVVVLLLLLVAVPLLAWALGQRVAPAPGPLTQIPVSEAGPPVQSPTPEPGPPARPTASAAGPLLDPELGVAIGEPLHSVAVAAPPSIDGAVEAAWDQAPALVAPLHYGLHGVEAAGTVELRSLYDEANVYFLARWPAVSAGGEPDVWRNLLTVHWGLVDSGQVSGEATASQGLACTVGCHTATADGRGGLVGIRSETIPPGLDDDLPAGGGWSEGTWTLEWSRPRASSSPYDQDLVDPGRDYYFFVKLFLGLEDRPDPATDVHELRLGR